MLAAAFAGTLFHALISFSVVCHINPPLFLCRLNLSGRHSAASAGDSSTAMPSEDGAEREAKAAGILMRSAFKQYSARSKAEQKLQRADGRKQSARERARRLNGSAES